MSNRTIAVNERDQQRKYNKICLDFTAVLKSMLYCGAKKQVQKVYVLHKDNTELVQKNDETFTNVMWENFVLT